MASVKKKSTKKNKKKSAETGAGNLALRFLSEFRNSWSAVIALFKKNKLLQLLLLVFGVAILTAVVMNFTEKNTSMYDSNYDTTAFKRFISGIYYAFISMTTTGYGDYAPDSVPGKLYAILLVCFGTITVSLITATVASILVERKLKEGRGLGDLSHMKNHFIVCGWKKSMEIVLNDMLRNNPLFECRDVVVIANVDPDKADIIREQNPCLKDMHFLRGDYFNEVMLKKANIEQARQVFILADESEEVTASETDSKTVMAAMTINTLARDVRMCAELLDTKYERYLQNAHVDEIIYTNDYGRMLLANASASTGLPRVYNCLLDTKSTVGITTHPVPFDYIGKTFGELADYFKKKIDGNLIGLVENVGSYWKHKQEAIRDAQKTPDISKLVTNLQKVSTMSSNEPNLHPGDDYVIPKNTLAVVLERRDK